LFFGEERVPAFFFKKFHFEKIVFKYVGVIFIGQRKQNKPFLIRFTFYYDTRAQMKKNNDELFNNFQKKATIHNKKTLFTRKTY
jgi:hypothetical protein